jgi:hypothetical protein
MTELVAMTAIVAAVAIVALVLGRPFRGRLTKEGVDFQAEPGDGDGIAK